HRARYSSCACDELLAVVYHERVRPDHEAEVVCDGPALRIEIAVPGHGSAEPRGLAASADGHERERRRARGAKREIEPAAPLAGTADRVPRGETKRAIVEDHRERRGNDDLLAADSEQAGGDRGRVPADSATAGVRVPRAERAVERGDVAERGEQFRALDDVVDGLALDRVQQPQRADGCGERIGKPAPV